MADIEGVVKSKLTSTDARELPVADIALEQRRLLHFKRLYDYYIFNRENLLKYTARAMAGTFKSKTIRKMQFPLYNFVKKIINQLAVAYLLPAERYIVGEKRDREFVNAEDAKAQEMYQRILSGSNINAASKTWNRMAKLLDTVYVGVMWRDGHIEYDIFPPHSLSVLPDENNYLEPKEVRYERAFGDKTYEVRWTVDEYEVLDEHGKRVGGDANKWNGENRYGVIPLIPCRLSVPEDHWGEGDTELVSVNEKINILVASSFYNALLQSHGILFAKNMNLGQQMVTEQQISSLFGGSETPELSSGPDWVMEANNVSKDDAEPSLEFVNPEPAIEANIKKIDWMLKALAVSKGLSAASVSLEANEQSGKAKQIDLLELRERRQDDIEFLRPFEKRLFDVTRTVWNVQNPGEKLSEKAVFGIDFVEPEPVMDEMQRMSVMEKKMGLGLASPVDMMKDEDEGIDEELAMQYIEKNMEMNKRIREMKGEMVEDGKAPV